MVSDITDKLLPKIEEWQNRPLSPVYPIVFIDAVPFSVRDDGVIRKLAAYVESRRIKEKHQPLLQSMPLQITLHL